MLRKQGIRSELKNQLIGVGELHDRDLAVNYDGVFTKKPVGSLI
jgi:hypothetical protein